MSYATIAAIRQDPRLRDRVAACVATEPGDHNPDTWGPEHSWALAATPGWAASWESALITNKDVPGYQPGADEGAITDGAILAAVQQLMALDAAEQTPDEQTPAE